MEDFVTYEQAVRLKELGFDWKIFAFYLGTTLNTNVQSWEIYNTTNLPIISAPTLSQAQKWLREVKQIDLFVTKELSKYYWYIGEDFQIGSCDTYEDALSNGIDKVIEMIKINNL